MMIIKINMIIINYYNIIIIIIIIIFSLLYYISKKKHIIVYKYIYALHARQLKRHIFTQLSQTNT